MHSGSIEHAMAGDGAEGELQVATEFVQQTLELVGGVTRIGPGPAELGSQRAEGRTHQA